MDRTNTQIDTLLTRLGSLPVPGHRGPVVYFARKADAIKIGFSHRVSKRLKNLKSPDGIELVLLGTVPGDIDLERQYHQRFSHLRIAGEWFHADQELLETIEAEKAPLPAPTYSDIANAFLKEGRKKLRRPPYDGRLIHAETNVGFWLNMLKNGETPERLASLDEALDALEKARAA